MITIEQISRPDCFCKEEVKPPPTGYLCEEDRFAGIRAEFVCSNCGIAYVVDLIKLQAVLNQLTFRGNGGDE